MRTQREEELVKERGEQNKEEIDKEEDNRSWKKRKQKERT